MPSCSFPTCWAPSCECCHGTAQVYRSSLQALQAAAPLPGPVAVPLAAATAGLALSCVLSPAELVKCRLQLGAADPLHCYSGPLDCLRQLLREEGWRRGLGRGLGATMAREVPGNAIYFSTYAVRTAAVTEWHACAHS